MKNYKIDTFYKKHLTIIITSLIFAIISALLFKISIFNQIELKTIDYRFNQFKEPTKADTNVVIIAIDDNSLKYFGKNNISWPWPREFYATLTDYLSQNGAKRILFDILFDQPDINREETDAEETDGKFAESIKNNKNVVLASKLLPSKHVPKNISKFEIDISEFNPKLIYTGGVFPIDIFTDNALALGVINVIPDKDGIIRRVPIFYKFQNKFLSQMGITPFYKDKKINFNKKKFIIGKKEIPTDSNGIYFVNWYSTQAFKYYTFSSVIQSAYAEMFHSKPLLPSNLFKGKTVLVGSTASGIDDLISSPFNKPIPGVELWATVISNIKNNDYIHLSNGIINFFILWIMAFLTIFLFVKIKNKISTVFLILLPVFIILIAFWLFKNYRIAIPITSPLFVFVIAFLYSTLISYFMEGKSRKELKRVFSRYLDPGVIEQIINNPEKIKLGGASIHATVLFSDIANFTTFSEDKTAVELINFLNRYFESITDFVLSSKGLLDKYTGDGIMAIFGAPVEMKEHAILACKAALMHKHFADTTDSDVAFLHKNTRIGINSGVIVAGNLGSEKKTDYTAIGDDVNLAARLEGVNKIYKTSIIISESTYELVKDKFLCRELDKLKVKGKNKPTTIYELIDTKKDIHRWIKTYEIGLVHYRNAKWDKAIEKFDETLKLKKDDYPSILMIERCKDLKVRNPKNWDGIITLKTK